MDRVRNVGIRNGLRVDPLLEETERIQLRWHGHVMRMTD